MTVNEQTFKCYDENIKTRTHICPLDNKSTQRQTASSEAKATNITIFSLDLKTLLRSTGKPASKFHYVLDKFNLCLYQNDVTSYSSKLMEIQELKIIPI